MLILETERLWLRRPVPADVDALWALYQQPDVHRHIPDAPRSREETEEEVAWFVNGHPDHAQLGLWSTINKADRRCIGRCGLLPWTLDGVFEVEVAYMIDPAYWGQGLASEAARAIRDYGFGALGYTRLICLIEAENHASMRVAQKLGMAFERDAQDDQYGPYQIWSMVRPA